MPMVTSTIEERATAHDSSPSARQAAMPVTTAPRQASRRPTEFSGGPGRLALLHHLEQAHDGLGLTTASD